MAWLTAGMALAAAAFYGGWEWVLVCLLVLTVLWRTDFRAASVLASVAPGLCWLALYYWTTDRRLFFPYSMQYAVQMAGLTGGPPATRAFGSVIGGGSVMLVFVLIRVAQSATAGVLLVELLVASAVLAISATVQDQSGRAISPSDTMARALVAALSSLAAYAGLAF